MRTLQLLTLVLFAVAARAETITFTPTSCLVEGWLDYCRLDLRGTFATDGVCISCSGSQYTSDAELNGLTSFTIYDFIIPEWELPIDPMDIPVFPHYVSATYHRSSNTLSAFGQSQDDFLWMHADGTYHATMDGSVTEDGTFVVNRAGPIVASPEPSALVLLGTVALIGLVLKRKLKCQTLP
jgi:hypothetical protein